MQTLLATLLHRLWIRPLSMLRLTAALLIALGGTQTVWAIFTVKSDGVISTLSTGSSPLGTPAGIVTDISGNVYVTDTTNSRILRITADGVTASVLSITGLSPALSAPKGLAIDSVGNLYVADTGNSRIVKVSTSGAGSILSTPSVTLNAPQGVAVDGSGNIYVANTGSNQIVKVSADGSSASADLTGSLASPRGIAVDGLGNLYIADTGNSRVVKVNATSPFSSGSINATVTTAAGVALNAPSDVKITNNNVLYIADTNTTEGGHPTPGRVVIVDSQGNAIELLTGYPVFNSPRALAVDAFGQVFVVDNGGTSNAGRVQSFQSYTIDTSDTFASSLNFGHVQLGSAGTSISVPISVSSDTTLSSINVYTNGTQNLDFTITNDSTCAAATTNTDCTVTVTFAPTAAGVRRGSLVLSYTSTDFPPGALTIPIFGVADAPVAALSPGVASVLSVGTATITDPFQEAVDGAGNIYVTSYAANKVIAIPAGGGSGTNVNTGSFTPSQPTGVAIDASGNLFIADYGNARIIKVATSGTASLFAISGLSTGISFPTALAFDAANNLYITDYGNGRIVEVNPYGQGTVLATGSYSFSEVNITSTAVDSLGNVYIADRNNNQIVKVDPRGSATLLSLPSLTLSDPQGVAVDPSNNLYVMDSGNERIIQVTTSGAVSVMAFSGVTIGPTIFGITPDANGNILVGDWDYGRLVKINVGQSALTFADTNTNSVSSDSPKTATVTNLGDQPLVFSADPTYTTDFIQSQGDPNPCISGTSLSAGTNCDVPIEFAPLTASSLSETVMVTNNTLNVASSTQQIAVSGTGISAGDTTTSAVSINPAAASYGQTLTITVTVSDTTTGHTTVKPTGSVTVTDQVGSTITQLNNGAAVTLNASGTATLTGVLLSGIGSHTITATYAGIDGTFQSSSITGTIVNSKSGVSIAGPSTPVSIVTGQAGSIPITVAGLYGNGNPPSGTLSYSILNSANTSVSSGTATLTAATSNSTTAISIPGTLASGTYTLTLTYIGDADYLSPSAATVISFHVGQITPTLTWSVSGAIPYGNSLSGLLSASAANGDSAVPGSFSYTATLAGGSAVAVNAGTVLGAGSYTLTATFTPADTTLYATVSATAALTVNQASSTATLTSSANPAMTTGAVSFTATVTATVSTGGPTGTIRFLDGSSLLATVALTQGQAIYTTTFAAGTHSITAVYSGDGNFLASTAPAVAEVVSLVKTSATLVSSANPSIVTNPVAFTMAVLSSSGTPTGTVKFYDETTLLGTVALTKGEAVYTTASLAVGAHSITAVYSGDSNFSAVTSPAVAESVNLATAGETLTSSANPAIVTSAVTFTVAVASSAGTPTGSVGIYDGTTLLGTVVLTQGEAAYTTASLAVGTHSITSVYSGDGTFAAITSPAVSELIQDFTLGSGTGSSSGAPPTATVNPGGEATYTLAFGPTAGTVFPNPVTLSLSGLPPGATGTLSPSTLPAGSSLTSVTLTIQLPAQTADFHRGLHPGLPLAIPALALVILPFAGRLRRSGRALRSGGFRRLTSLLILLAAGYAAIAGTSGCGSKNSGFFGQQPQSYTVVITATSGSLSHSTSVILNVQ